LLIKRRTEIMQYLKEREIASIDELCKEFDISKSTVRRDIDELETQGIIKKVYGGVVLVKKEENNVVPISVREINLIEEKNKIAKVAADMINDNDVVIIDAGSTTVQMIKFLGAKKNITIITNSISVINDAMPYEELNIILTGGNLLRDTNSLVGIDAINIIKSLNARIAFIGATGISLTRGISNSSMIEAEIKKTMIRSADKIILMVDNTKFDVASLVTFAELDYIDEIITDITPDEKYENYFIKNNIKLIIAK